MAFTYAVYSIYCSPFVSGECYFGETGSWFVSAGAVIFYKDYCNFFSVEFNRQIYSNSHLLWIGKLLCILDVSVFYSTFIRLKFICSPEAKHEDVPGGRIVSSAGVVGINI